MKEAIWRYPARTIEKPQTLLNYQPVEQMVEQTLPGSALRSSYYPWLRKASQHIGPAAQKSNVHRCALSSLRFVMILMSLCLSLPLTIASMAMVTSSALAAGPAAANSNIPDPNGYKLYTTGLCQSWTHETVPDAWKNAGLCDASPGQSFVQGAPTNGSCGQNQIAVMTVTGQKECVLTVPSLRSECPIGFALIGGQCAFQPEGRIGWDVGICQFFPSGDAPIPPAWIQAGICDTDPIQNPGKFVNQSGTCGQDQIKVTSRTGQEECVITVPGFKSQCPVGFALDDGGRCAFVPQDIGVWQTGFCKSFTSNQVPLEWIKNGVCDINPVPDPQQTFVKPSGNGSCNQSWVATMTLTGQQECVMTLPPFKGDACPIGFVLRDGHCEFVPQNSGSWRVGLCKSFTGDEIPPEWTTNRICDFPIPDPETTFLKSGPCQQGWIATTAASTQVQCLLTIPNVRGLCPIGFALDAGRCDYVPQGKTSWQAGFCRSFSSDEIPPEWKSICTIPSPDPETTFIKPVPCQQGWIETTSATGQVECILTVPSVRGLCPVGFALDGSKCDYVPQSKTTWVVGFCKSFNSDEVPPEWMSMHVCDTNPVPDPEQTFIKAGPCADNWIRTVAEGGDTPKCALKVPAIRELCPIGFALDGADCNYVPKNTIGWQFPCSDQGDGTPDEGAIANDWLSGNSPDTQSVTSDATVTDGTTGGRFVHTFAADTYGLQSVQEVFSSMLGLAFVLVTPMVILVGYQIMLAASSFRHAGALEGLSRVFLGGLAVGVSFQLVTMLISFANVISSAIVDLHGMLGYASTQTSGVRAVYTLAGVSEPVTSYRGMLMPMSRWGCAINDFIGVLGSKFLREQVASWLPVIGNLAPLATQVTNGAQLASRLTEFARLVFSVALWLQAVIRIGILNCYILTCPLAFACWSLPGGLGQQVLRQWTRGFLGVLFIQVMQLFLITTLPLILPSFPALVGDHQGIMQVVLTQLPPLLVLWMTVMVPNFVGISATRAIGMTGMMAGGIVGAVGEAASRLG